MLEKSSYSNLAFNMHVVGIFRPQSLQFKSYATFHYKYESLLSSSEFALQFWRIASEQRSISFQAGIKQRAVPACRGWSSNRMHRWYELCCDNWCYMCNYCRTWSRSLQCSRSSFPKYALSTLVAVVFPTHFYPSYVNIEFMVEPGPSDPVREGHRITASTFYRKYNSFAKVTLLKQTCDTNDILR